MGYLLWCALGELRGCSLLSVLPVAFQQLVEQHLLAVTAWADEWWEGIPLQLDDSHLGTVDAVLVGDLQQMGVTAGVGLKAGCQHLEQFVDKVLLLRGDYAQLRHRDRKGDDEGDRGGYLPSAVRGALKGDGGARHTGSCSSEPWPLSSAAARPYPAAVSVVAVVAVCAAPGRPAVGGQGGL